MGVSRDDDSVVAFTAQHERRLQVFQQAINTVNRGSNPETQVGRDLVVAAASGVKFPARITNSIDQRLFDIHVDIFQFFPDIERPIFEFGEDLGQVVLDFRTLVAGQDLLISQHVGMCDAAGDVMAKQSLVKADTLGEPLNPFVHG